MSTQDLANAKWRKSSMSGTENTACVEVAPLGDLVGMRDSKDPAGPALVFAAHQFQEFIDAIRNGALR